MTAIQELLPQLVAGTPMSAEQAVDAFETIMTGQATDAQLGALLALIQARGATIDEITGAAQVMRRKVTAIGVPPDLTLIDTCGTGGDHASTFNISTAAAIVAAAAGRPKNVAVAKHGNRSVTSRSGSSQAFEQLGVKLKVAPDTMTRCLDEAGICFCFAPSHHPAMKHAAPVRGQLGIATIFNVLGPLTNPAGADRQVMGVFSPDLTEPIAQVLARLGSKRAMVVCGRFGDGILDELTTTGITRITNGAGSKIQTSDLNAADLGLARAAPVDLQVDSPEASAQVITNVLSGRAGPARDIVCLNAAAALNVAGAAQDLKAGLRLATEAIDSGAARKTLQTLVAVTQADREPSDAAT